MLHKLKHSTWDDNYYKENGWLNEANKDQYEK